MDFLGKSFFLDKLESDGNSIRIVFLDTWGNLLSFNILDILKNIVVILDTDKVFSLTFIFGFIINYDCS